jgi:hypothetical protein
MSTHTPTDIIVKVSTCPRCGNDDQDKITWESAEIYDEGESVQEGTCKVCACYWTEHFERKFQGVGIHNEETGDTPFYEAPSAPALAEENERLRTALCLIANQCGNLPLERITCNGPNDGRINTDKLRESIDIACNALAKKA